MNAKEMDEPSKIVEQLTLEEKACLCSRKDFWNLKAVERLGLDSIMVTDGPHSLRKQAGESDHLGINQSVPIACFPWKGEATVFLWEQTVGISAYGKVLPWRGTAGRQSWRP
jgi:beta-glucosidase